MRLFKYLKRMTPLILIAVVLLFVQAYCDLALPQYTSDIVNVGIQQKGIESSIPEKIRKSELTKITAFMSEKDKDYVLNSYKEGKTIYTLKSISDQRRDKLEDIIAVPMLVASSMSKGGEKQAAAVVTGINMMRQTGMLSKNADVYDILSALAVQNSKIDLSQLNKLKTLDKKILKQMCIAYVQKEYKAVDINVDKMQSNYILNCGLKMLGIALIAATASILVTLLSSRIGAGFAHDIRNKVFNKVIDFSHNEYNKFSTSSLITRCTNDIQQVQMLVIMALRMVVYAPILGVGALFKVMNTDRSMTWIIALAVISILVLIGSLFVATMPRFRSLQKLIDKLTLISRETLTGLPVIRAFNKEEHEEKRFDLANIDLTKTNLFVNRVMTLVFPAMMLILNLITLLIVWVGADAINAGTMQVGNLMAFMQYAMQIIMAFLILSLLSIMLPRAMVSARRINEVIDTEVSINDPEVPKALSETVKGIVEFNDVSFRYPGAQENVLKNISFVANPGETTAFIGSTGSGKSTLINLIPRFYDVSDGKITIDGTDIREVTLHDLRDKLGYVPQKGVLFSGTIGSNIAYGEPDLNMEAIEKAAEISQATDFIDEKAEKYASEISQGGTNVSGGQRQRLSIARAVAKKPKIYIFDDSFSALDFKTDVALRKALFNSTKDSTVLIVAQRISTVLNADKIVVLDEGEVVGIGTHKELIDTCEVYNQIASSQLSREEMMA